jgi:PTS system nitrogen regulatory IIA component
MDFASKLRSGCFCLDLKANTKDGIITELVDAMVAEGLLPDREAALKAVLEREGRISTGLQYGVAVPHGKTATVKDLVVAFGIKRSGVDFAAEDGDPSRIFVMTISSPLRTGPHLKYLSEISKMLTNPRVRSRVLESWDRQEIIAILLGTRPVQETTCTTGA